MDKKDKLKICWFFYKLKFFVFISYLKNFIFEKYFEQEFEKKNGIKVIEVSAKSSQNVDLAFKTIVENLIERK